PPRCPPATLFPYTTLVRSELKAIKGVACAVEGGAITEDDVAGRFTAQERSAPVGTEQIALVEHNAGGRASTIDVAGRHDAGIVLTPLRGGNILARTAVGVPVAGAIAREPAGVAVFKQVGRARRGRIVVVVLKHIAEGRDRLLVTVAETMSDDFDVGAVGIHAGGETTDINVTVVT